MNCICTRKLMIKNKFMVIHCFTQICAITLYTIKYQYFVLSYLCKIMIKKCQVGYKNCDFFAFPQQILALILTYLALLIFDF